MALVVLPSTRVRIKSFACSPSMCPRPAAHCPGEKNYERDDAGEDQIPVSYLDPYSDEALLAVGDVHDCKTSVLPSGFEI